MAGKWKMGLVGLGGSHRSAAYMHHPQIEVTAICDVDTDILERVGNDLEIPDASRYSNYDDILNADIDIVMIGSPVPYHAQQAIRALDSGRHVLSEVTAAATVQDCFAILDAVNRSKRTYMMAENTVYFHFLREWKTWARAGQLGQIYYAECEYVHAIRHLVVNRWRDGRPPLHYCSHSLGPILEIMDDYIVRATGAGMTKTILPGGGVGSIDIQVALFETAKGGTIKLLRSSVAAKEPGGHFYSVYGSKGHVENGRSRESSQGWLYLEDRPGSEDGPQKILCEIADPAAPPEAKRGGHGTSEYYLLRDFIQALDTGTSPPIDVYRSLEYTLPGIVAHEAVERGGVWLDVPRVRD